MRHIAKLKIEVLGLTPVNELLGAAFDVIERVQDTGHLTAHDESYGRLVQAMNDLAKDGMERGVTREALSL